MSSKSSINDKKPLFAKNAIHIPIATKATVDGIFTFFAKYVTHDDIMRRRINEAAEKKKNDIVQMCYKNFILVFMARTKVITNIFMNIKSILK